MLAVAVLSQPVAGQSCAPDVDVHPGANGETVVPDMTTKFEQVTTCVLSRTLQHVVMPSVLWLHI